ncbi:nucleotidyl transferase AbiEii/AbiGii toxin family protein [Streptomyces rhizosphaericus]|uniref:nucleotidyl transferase AbiEii/AbiGii toxin family protein n=1 Tax=Streptomyces rhizosphaericus TaxID=114699 RepID=UPI00142DB2A0|nr:nucleotidyl transferase AbiEii/AbiGii toxin family protein [Streptomyces rhizosphaericus]
MNREQQLEIARIALTACAERGYALAGSLALHVHRVAGARDADDIDLFVNQILDDADTVRQEVAQTLRTAGYQVQVAATWGYSSATASAQNGELTVSHPQHSTSTTVQMACMARSLKPVNRAGVTVYAIGECLYHKIEALQDRLQAKDFIDLVLLQAHMNQLDTDRYISMYIRGIAHYEGRPETETARDLYQAFAQVAQIPDEAFDVYGYTSAQAVDLRTIILAWAERLVPQFHPMRRDIAVAAGRVAITHQDAQRALARMACNPWLTRLSDQQLSTWRAEATSTLMRDVADRGSTQHTRQQLHPITDELGRRARLTPHERAAEDAVRRAEEAELMAGGDPSRLGPRGVIARLKPPAPPPVPPRPSQTLPTDALRQQQHTQPNSPDTGTGQQI